MFSEDRADFIASFDEYDLLIIDDLGVERSTEYAMEQMFFVIDSRYRSRRPMIITTNLKPVSYTHLCSGSQTLKNALDSVTRFF